MCLDFKRSRKAKKKWLKKQPDIVVAYKIVREVGVKNTYYPLHQRAFIPFEDKTNSIRWLRMPILTTNEDALYIPYYHLYLSSKDAHYMGSYRKIIMKCHVPKKSITAVGSQDGHTTIVTTKFEFKGEAEK